jgi:phosphopantetheinyl transferase (holo-ACP synthase)
MQLSFKVHFGMKMMFKKIIFINNEYKHKQNSFPKSFFKKIHGLGMQHIFVTIKIDYKKYFYGKSIVSFLV